VIHPEANPPGIATMTAQGPLEVLEVPIRQQGT